MTQINLKQSDDQTQDSSSELSSTQEGMNEVNHSINVNHCIEATTLQRSTTGVRWFPLYKRELSGT